MARQAESALPIIEMRDISKAFGAVQALRGVDLKLYPGEILGLVGDNSAGKSTLMKIMTGAYHRDSGEIIVGGVDASPDALQEMDKGRLNVTVFQNAKGQGEGGIKVAISLAKGEPVEKYTWIPFELVTPDNYKDYMN